MKKRTKILLAILAALVLIQFIRPAKNLSNDQTYHVSTKYAVSDSLQTILKVACNDCHSNLTVYPWYAEVQPSAWWLASHVKGGKRHLNLSEFTNRPIAVQNHKFEEIIELVGEKKSMPLKSYTWFGLHHEAKLTDRQRQIITDWTQGNMDFLKANYPADSLVLKRPGR